VDETVFKSVIVEASVEETLESPACKLAMSLSAVASVDETVAKSEIKPATVEDTLAISQSAVASVD